MCDKIEKCAKVISTFTNNFGDEENQTCIREKGHSGRCTYRPDYKVFGQFEIQMKNKLNNSALSTAGETAKNSPIMNRALRWKGKPISIIEESKLKAEGSYRVGIRKDEASSFQNCTEVEQKLYNVVRKVFLGVSDESTCCHICGEQFHFDDFLLGSKNPNSIQICHDTPLSENEVMHTAKNCFWGHRQCNIIQGDQSIENMNKRIQKILEYQNSKNTL